MITERLSKRLVLSAGLVVALGAFCATDVFAGQARSRGSSSGVSQGGGGSTATRGGGGSATRGGGGGSRGAASTRSGRGGGGGGHYGGGRHGGRHSGGRGYYGHGRYGYGISLGYYGWGGYLGYGGYFYNPFYYHYPVYHSSYPRGFEDFGALDLNVRPKKTEVWIDGQYVGTAGRFDGYPGHLWLEDGPHELILFRQGRETVVREVNVLAGVVLDISMDMVAGEAIAAEQMTSFTQEELRERRAAADTREWTERPERRDGVERVTMGAERAPEVKDAREEPARLTLAIEPVDASIYLDGRFLGTGEELSRLHSGLIVAPGEHTLEVVRPGFDSENLPFSVEAGEESTLEVALNTV